MPLRVFPVGLPGGLQESREDPIAQGWDQLDEVTVYRGRMALRAPIVDLGAVPNSGGGDVDAILGLAQYKNKLVIAGYDDSLDEVNLVSADKDGTNMAHEAVIWSSVTTQPTAVIMEPITAGTASSPEQRLYIADFDQTNETRFWNDTTMTTLTEDLNLDSTAEDVVFSYIKVYQYHLWGTRFFEGTTTRGEMLRYSTPGLVPLTDFASGNDVDWHVNDHVSVGRRGDSIVGLEVVNGRLLVFQQEAMHAITGYDRDTWTLETISPVIGAAGPNAFDHYAGRECYFWSSTGPMVTDGTQVQDIGEAIRDTVNDVSPDENVFVIVDPAQQNAYFFVDLEGELKQLVFDIQQQVWTKGQFLEDDGDALDMFCGTRLSELGSVAAGPNAAPSSLTATIDSADRDGTIDLSWTNGDTAINTETYIHRDTSTGFTPGSSNQIAVVESSIDEYEDSGLTADTTYYYIVRHKRNNQFSSDSNEANDQTALPAPSSVTLKGLVNGIEVTVSNSYGSAVDIIIQRRTTGGSYSTLTTLSSVTGSQSHDDTTASCGTTYQYKARLEKAGSTNSSYTESVELEACSGLPEINNVQYTVDAPDPNKPHLKQVTFTWEWSNKGVRDKVWIYKDDVLQDKVSGTSWSNEVLNCGVSQSTIDFDLEVHIENEEDNISETETFNNTDPCAAA